MTTWHEYIQQNGAVPEWPYPIRYSEERLISTDVLVLGGGIAGCHAAINARRKGAAVVVVEKEATKWSGNGEAGVDHWLSACTNPCSRVSLEEFAMRAVADCGGYDCGPLRYVNARESWDALLDCERMGVQIRDIHGEFKGADFRDDETQLMFAYDYVKQLAPNLPERIQKGEFVLPLYADLSRLPEHERRAIFGLMVGNEGMTRVPVYDTLTQAGFDPDLDLLQAPVMRPESYGHANFWAGMAGPHWLQWGRGGLVVDWDLRTNLESLYAAGGAIYGGGDAPPLRAAQPPRRWGTQDE